jgi:outer membrane receptor for ferrienterochelin and colicin
MIREKFGFFGRVLSGVAVLAIVLSGGSAAGQGLPSATLTGRVTQAAQALPGVTVTARSPNLQGSRSATTTLNGDYAFNNMPPGEYTITFELSGFQTVTRAVRLAASQKVDVDAAMSLAGVAAEAIAVARAESISTSTQAATTYDSDLLNKLPTARTLLSAVNLTPGVNQNGPRGSTTISGAMSFENLFTVNGVVVTDNIRAAPNSLFIEDAIQETTTSTAAISAEFGRFTGGVVNAITKAGGNTFSGSFRTSLNNDAWTAVSPAGETRVQSLIPTYEATLGGPIWKDRIWFFGAGRLSDTTGSGQTAYTNIPYETGNDEKRYEGKLTLTPLQNHAVTASYTKIDQDVTNDNQGYFVLDLDSVTDRSLPQELLSVNYSGVFSGSFSADAQYSRRKFTFEGSGSKFTDLIKGTNIFDTSRPGAPGTFANFNSPVFCGVCSPENRDNENFLVKGTWFASSPALGSHNVVFGYDNFSGSVTSNNYQSGSNYTVFATSAILGATDNYPVFDAATALVYWPIEQLSQGSDLRTHSVFANDQWRLSDHFSFNLGVRWDRNDAKDQGGVTRASDSAFSPRVAAVWDVRGDGKLRVAASYAKYLAAINEVFVSGATPAGTPSILYWYYDGPGATPINTGDGPFLTRAQALQQLFDWFQSNNCPNLSTCQIPLAGAQVPGFTERINESLDSPNAKEYSVGVSGALGSRTSWRVDGVYREYGGFYNGRRDISTGISEDPFGNRYDVTSIENTDLLERKYVGLHTQFAARILDRLSVGGNWTWSHTYGNFDGENTGSGPLKGGIQFYPEYFSRTWSNPRGDLTTDQRHRVRAFAVWDAPTPARFGSLSLSVLQAYDSGTPYGAIGPISTQPYVTNPGYVTPPQSVNYFFTSRNAFHWDAVSRTDLGLTYSLRIAGAVEIFVQPQVLNAFNNQAVIAGDTSVRTAFNAARFLPFNPFTETPVQGPRPAAGGTPTTNWDYGPTFGQPRNVADYQLPRTFRVSMGVRF